MERDLGRRLNSTFSRSRLRTSITTKNVNPSRSEVVSVLSRPSAHYEFAARKELYACRSFARTACRTASI